MLRGTPGILRLGQIVEKGFFIDSSHSLPLQLCDLFALSLRKGDEVRLGLPPKSVDASGIQKAQALASIANGGFADVIAWLTQQQNERKKEATGG